MASFSSDTRVLRFPWRHSSGQSRWLLWPALGFRVVAPSLRRRELNVFERAVLGLCRAGCFQVDRVAERLLLAPALAAHILIDLTQRHYLDHAGAPTKRGVELLDEADDELSSDPICGYVFRDPDSQELWPRLVVTALPYAETGLDEQKRLRLLRGSVGNPQQELTFSIPPRSLHGLTVPAPPSADEVIRASRAHRRKSAWLDETDPRDTPLLGKVTLIDEHAEPFWLAVRVDAPNGELRAADPFGLGDNPHLLSWIEARLDEPPVLRRFLAPLIGDESEEPDVRTLHAQAEWEVESRLTVQLRRFAPLHERMVAMQRALLESEQTGAPSDKRNDVVIKAQRAAERLFALLTFEAATFTRPQVLLTESREFNAELLNSIAASLGFHTPLPESLSMVRRGKVEALVRSRSGSLGPHLVLALLLARTMPDHPLRRAASRVPELLTQLDSLARLRDRAAHDSQGEISPAQTRVAIDTVYAAVETLFLSLPSRGI